MIKQLDDHARRASEDRIETEPELRARLVRIVFVSGSRTGFGPCGPGLGFGTERAKILSASVTSEP